MAKLHKVLRVYTTPNGTTYIEAEVKGGKKFTYGKKAFETKYGKLKDYKIGEEQC